MLRVAAVVAVVAATPAVVATPCHLRSKGSANTLIMEIYRLLLALLCCALQAEAASLLKDAKRNPLGSSDEFGYVHYSKELFKIGAQNSERYPIRLSLSSNPRVAPRFFGPCWQMPLFDSTAYMKNSDVLVWVAPDDRVRFFMLSRDAKPNGRSRRYVGQDSSWTAVFKEKDNEVTFTDLSDRKQFYTYRDGLLWRYSGGSGFTSTRVYRDGSGYVHSVTSEESRQVLMEVTGQGGSLLSISTDTGERVSFRVENISGFDNLKSDYKGGYLTEIIYPEPNRTDHLSYSSYKEKGLSKNRLKIDNAFNGGGYFEWLSGSGFIVADSAGSYRISNPSYDLTKKNHSKRKPATSRVAPTIVKIINDVEDNASKSWERNWLSGTIVVSDLDGGFQRMAYIQTPGPLYGMLRKVERRESGSREWLMVQLNSFDHLGRLSRRILENGDVFNFVYHEGGNWDRIREMSDGNMEVQSYDSKNRILMRKVGEVIVLSREYAGEQLLREYKKNSVKRFNYNSDSELESVEIFRDEVLVGRHRYSQRKLISSEFF